MTATIAYTHDAGIAEQSLKDKLASNAHWTLRIALASVFIFHGWLKLAALGGFSQMLGLPISVVLLVALAEFVGGILILAGAFTRDWVTRLGAGFFIPVLAGAIAMVHWGQWNFVPSENFPMGGSEFQVTLLLISLYFVLKGNRA
jgi:putative oxidoreductase